MADQRDEPCAVRMPQEPRASGPLDEYLHANKLEAAIRFAAKDDDDLNDAVCAGKIRRVIFMELADLLDAIWAGHVKYTRWLELGVKVDLVRAPFHGPVEWPSLVESMADSFTRFRQRERRHQVVAAVILSLMAIIAMAALLWTIPPAR